MRFLLSHRKDILKGIGLVTLLLAARGFQAEREARIRFEAELKGSQESIQAERRKLAEAEDRIAARAEETKKLVAEIEKLKARPATVREIIRELPQYIPVSTPPELAPSPGQPAPIGEPRAASIDNAGPEPSLIFSPEQANELRRFYLDCREMTLQLDRCLNDETDWAAKESALRAQVVLTEKQRDAAVRAVKGGGFWRRLVRDSKTFIVGAALGAAAVAIAK